MVKVIYIACSSYSGSTLLTFLLNTHPKITTAGHMIGWDYRRRREFYCSCGEKLKDCPFYRHIAAAYEDRALPFEFWDFGTDYRLAQNERVNQVLTAGLPGLQSRGLEKLRDVAVKAVPGLATKLRRIDRSNQAFIEAALSHSGATVFVENGHTAHRLARLNRLDAIDLRVVHLVRDIRAVTHSYVKNRDWNAATAARLWLREQSDIHRMLPEVPRSKTIRYDDLCDSTPEALSEIVSLVGLEPIEIPPDFRDSEHHILGNTMRLGSTKISKDTRWRGDMSKQDRDSVDSIVSGFIRRNPKHPVSRLVTSFEAQA